MTDEERSVIAYRMERAHEAIDEANAQLARYESIKRFSVLPVEFSQETGELTPTLKVKRKIVGAKYKEQIDRMYAE